MGMLTFENEENEYIDSCSCGIESPSTMMKTTS